ncbi:DNA polymerase III subunit alpha [Janibacter sp. YIM B02568]|uniref:DNA polymerase III subunit alpha n=1 Tax=Janibacter endophyticus TaxID=2806261 RepID=UPI0019520EAD|nr:DNA polymerase III subunit alpha [Janibacter endophyticus]MBM6546221.1 DNA polymerase III subunit alpha [Janibacter endophyticus]
MTGAARTVGDPTTAAGGSPFAHLRVASGYSLRHGTATPEALVARAAEHGQRWLALTDRDGLYGAVRHVRAAAAAGIEPLLGVDLAVRPGSGPTPPTTSRTPVRGGASVDPRHPRVTVLARGAGAGVPHALGWARLCRLVSEAHLVGERGQADVEAATIARHARGPEGERSPLVVLLGPDSDVGRALLARRPDEAMSRLRRWVGLLGRDGVVVEVVDHGGPAGTPASTGHAALLLALADAARVRAVLTGAVRHLDPADSVVADVLDATRRLVVLDTRHLDRVSDAGHLASTPTMTRVAHRAAAAGIGRGAGRPGESARQRGERLLADTLATAAECAQDPRHDLGIGRVHLPEASVLGIAADEDPMAVLTQRCRAAVGRRYPGADDALLARVHARLDEELRVIDTLGYPTYFLTVATVVDLITEAGVRVAARGSGAGSLVNHLLGISAIDPIRYGLLMERFCSPLRAELPDIDIDVESARRTEIYELILERFGRERVTCVSMMDTYKARHAIRDVGAALGMTPGEVDEIAKSFPHIRARDVRSALEELPELRSRGLGTPRLRTLFELVERLDGLPRHIALHPCGVVLSDAGLLDRTPVESSWLGFPMSQFDKDDVEVLGLLKLDVLGIRMQSAMAYAVREVERVDGQQIDLDDRGDVPLDDEATFRMIRTTRTLGCFQIESPGQRELIGKLGPVAFEDLVVDISLFRPGPVKSDMIRPFLEARHGWSTPDLLHPSLVDALAETEGVVVFHEQMLQIIAETTGVSLAQADEVRRTMGGRDGQDRIEAWWRPAALARGYAPDDVDRIWSVLAAFASFGFCKAHAAAFAMPTYQSAWLKTHHPAAFLAGVLTHDPGMYPKRLILDDARSLGITVLPVDVNASTGEYRVERVGADLAGHDRGPVDPALPDGSGYGIRVALSDVRGMSEAEVARVVAGAPYESLADFWTRAQVSRPVVESLVLVGAFDAVHGIAATGAARSLDGAGAGSSAAGPGRRGRLTRRDLLLHVAELDRWSRSTGRPAGRRRGRTTPFATGRRGQAPVWAEDGMPGAQQVRTPSVTAAARQPVASQLTLDLGDEPDLVPGVGLPEMSAAEQVRAELDVLGLDASRHVMDLYTPMLDALGVTRSRDVLSVRSRSQILVAGVKVATQTPPIRSGRRVVFLTVDDSTGPVDATFFEDVQGPYAATIFHSWLVLVRGTVRRTGERGVSLLADGAWELPGLWDAWSTGGLPAVHAALEEADAMARARAEAVEGDGAPGRRVLVHASGFRQSPYADVRPAGEAVTAVPGRGRGGAPGGLSGAATRKLWHASPGSSGW